MKYFGNMIPYQWTTKFIIPEMFMCLWLTIMFFQLLEIYEMRVVLQSYTRLAASVIWMMWFLKSIMFKNVMIFWRLQFIFSLGPGGREGILGGHHHHQQRPPPHPQGGHLPPRGQDGPGGQRVRMGPIGEKKSTWCLRIIWPVHF